MPPSLGNRAVLRNAVVIGPEDRVTMVNGQQFQVSPNQTAVLTFEIHPTRESWLAWVRRLTFQWLFWPFTSSEFESQ